MNKDNKKYYWIRLRTDFFNQETIDFLLSQQNGCEYVVLYQMLCLITANTNGLFANQIGEVLIPYDIEKIVRDTKYFDYDTIVVALELFKKLGLVYEEENGYLKITDLEKMVGSESASRDAIKKREQRLKKKIEGTKVGTKCLIENRDKRLDIRNINNIYIKENKKEKNISYFLSILSANDYKYIKEDSPLFNKIKDWLIYKEERKEIYKQTGLQSLLKQIENKIDEYGEEQIINLIDECMASNYKGIIFDRLKNKTAGSKKVNVVPEWLGKDIKKGDFSEETERLCREVFGNNKE